MNPLTAFLTGLTTGGLTCMAVQGGLLLGVLSQQTDATGNRRRWSALVLPVAAFLVAKITAYTLLGLGLGAVGGKLQISSNVSVWLQSIAGVFIIITGIRIVFPRWLPWLAFTPPAGIRRFIRRQTKNDSWVTPAFLGLLTIFIPCGTTIAMETAAVATGQAFQGAAILLAFTLGTAPLFFLIGIMAEGTALVRRQLAWVTAAIVVGLGMYTFNGAMVMIDSPYTLQNEWRSLQWAVASPPADNPAAASTETTIEVRNTGYSPNEVTVTAGQPVTLNLAAAGPLGCTSVFRIPKLKIERTLQTDTTNTIVATFPSPGRYSFSCGMGMYTGTVTAI